MTMSIISSIVAGVSIIIFASSAASERWYGYYVYLDVPWVSEIQFHAFLLGFYWEGVARGRQLRSCVCWGKMRYKELYTAMNAH